MTTKKIIRDLRDTPFSLPRLFVWAVSIYGLIGVTTMSWLAIQEKPISPQIQSLTMFCVGALVARIERGKK
jgi:hypothetical protein